MASIREMAKPVTEIRAWRNIAMYGPPKSGKSVFAAGFPEPIHFDCDPGLGTISLLNHPEYRNNLVIPCRGKDGGIAKIKTYVQKLMMDSEGFETLTVDTISELVNWELMQHRLKNSGKVGYDPRQSYGDVQERFYELLTLMIDLPMNLLLLCHQREQEDMSDGVKRVVTRPALPPGIAALVNAAVDMTCYLENVPTMNDGPEDRILRVKAKKSVQAGTRLAFDKAILKNPKPKEVLTSFVPRDMVKTQSQEVASAAQS